MYAIARSTHERKSALQRRIAEQQKSRPHFAKSRQQISKTCPFFLQTPLFSGRVSLVVHRNGRRRHKRRAQSNRHSAIPPMTAALHRKKNPSSQQKTNTQLLLISKNDFTFAGTSSKNTLYRAPIALALCATSLPTKLRAAPIVDRPSWAIIFHHLISL